MLSPRVLLTAAVLAGAAVSFGCGGSSSSNTSTSNGGGGGGNGKTNLKGLVSFNQTVAATDGDEEAFPGQANTWDLDGGFGIVDGFNDQFDGALELSIGSESFGDSPQTYDELTFSNPALSTADGVVVATVSDTYGLTGPIAGTFSADLNSLSDARLQQLIDLSTATAPVTLSWDHDVSALTGNLANDQAYFRVVIRDTSGGNPRIVFAASGFDTNSLSVDISFLAGTQFLLSFEQRSASTEGLPGGSLIDSVSITDTVNKEFVKNGDFETGTLANWTTFAPKEVQNVHSGKRVMANGLLVSRSFFTRPNKLWGRWVDVFENPTSSDASFTATYETGLGSDAAGIIYQPTATALTTWDGSAEDRDVGFVFGSATALTFTSASQLNAPHTNGTNDSVVVTYDLVVPANGRLAVVNFVIMDGDDTGLTAGSTSVKATKIDNEALRIKAGMAAGDPEFFEGMSNSEKSAIINF